LTLYYETCLQWPCVDAIRRRLPLTEAEKDALSYRVGRERILQAPGEFLKLTARHYVSLWTAFKLRHPDTAAQLGNFVSASRPLPFEREAFRVAPGSSIDFPSTEIVRIVQPAILAAGGLTLLVALATPVLLHRGAASPALQLAGVAAATAHASLFFSALTAAGLSRFMVSVFAAVIVSVLVGLAAVFEVSRRSPWRVRAGADQSR
jgi:hypothetical protein